MKKLVLVIRTQKGGQRMNASSTNQSQGSKWWFVIQGNIPGNPIDTDKHYKKHRTDGSPKISKEKATTTLLNALQLTLWPH